jgi:histidinol-phosphatase (PHP family)
MMTRSSPHVHTQFCDGRSTAEEMVLAALEKNFVSLGFSSHAGQDFNNTYAMDERRETEYIREIRRLQHVYGKDIRIWMGVERDRLSIADRSLFEYVIGSSHYVLSPEGEKLPVDDSPKLLEAGIGKFFHGDGLAFAADFFALTGKYLRTFKPDIIGHFDLLTKHNKQNKLFDAEDPRYIKAATEAMDEAFTGCRLMEVNVGGIARAGASAPYPSFPLLQYWRAIGGDVILSSDCHDAGMLDSAYAAGAAFIRAAGYKKAAFLGRQESLFEWCEVL